ncbi:MAG: hypothetical protein ACOY3Z_12990 [Thermodesulfobacteriota bacterium]
MRWLQRLKPGAAIRTHLLTAAMMWSGIGMYLMGRAWGLVGEGWLLPMLALALGTLKGVLVLDRAARRNVGRIMSRQDGACLGGVYSWKMWGLVACMAVGGRLLRASGLPAAPVAVLYGAVGWGLFLASRLIWRQWWAMRSLLDKTG